MAAVPSIFSEFDHRAGVLSSPNELLQSILNQTKQLAGASGCALFKIEPQNQELRVHASIGLSEWFRREARAPLGQKAIGRALLEQRPIFIPDVFREPGLVRRAGCAEHEGFRALAAFPFQVQEQDTAVLCAYFASEHHFTSREAEILAACVSQAAAAKTYSYLYERERAAAAALKESLRSFQRQNDLLRRATLVHQQLLSDVLQGNGVLSITRALARLLNNPIIVANSHYEAISFSSPDRQLTPVQAETLSLTEARWMASEAKEVQDAIQEVKRSKKPVAVPALPAVGLDVARIVAPIVIGKEILGYITVLESIRKFVDFDLSVLEKAAIALACEFKLQEAGHKAEHGLVAMLLYSLLSDRRECEEMLLRQASSIGYDFSGPYRVLVLATARASLDSQRGANDIHQTAQRRLFTIASEACSRCEPRAIAMNGSNRIVIFLPLGGAEREKAEVFARDLLRTIRGSIREIAVAIGIGGRYDHLGRLRDSYEEALRALDVLGHRAGRDEVVSFDQLGMYHLLFRGSTRDELVAFADRLLGRLESGGSDHGGELISTLDAYLSEACNQTATARRLYVHVNTVLYRLRKIEERLGASLDDPDLRLNLQLALKVRRMFQH